MSDQPSSTPAPMPATSVPVEAVFRPRKRGAMSKAINGIGVAVVFLSIVLNVYLVMALAAMEAFNGRSAMVTRTLDEGAKDQTVAVYVLSDVIDGEAAAKFKAFYNAVEDDEDVKAVVLRVVSPGGSVSASAEIHRYITLLQEAGKKVVVSMGAVAATGGYYNAAPADLIVAEE